MSPTTIEATLARHVCSIGNDTMPDAVRTAARHSILDWIGCAIAGHDEPLSAILRDEVLTGDGAATIVGSAHRGRLLEAALVNGAAGHALDFDDTNLTMRGHPTAAVLPAVLALTEVDNRPGRDVVGALVVGTEVAVRVAAVLGAQHYERGWHTTGTAGVFGAAAATGWLLGLDEAELALALGIAGSQAGGLKGSFGTMTKPLHAGRAAADGLLAARLAARGFTGNPAIIQHPQGLGHASLVDGLSAPPNLELDRWFTAETLFKFHAACYGTHATIGASLDARARLTSSDVIEAVTVTVAPSLLEVCGIPDPRSGLEGKFSLRATAALALLGANTADLSQFTDERMAAADLVDLRDRIRVDTAPDRTSAIADVRVVTSTGQVVEASADSSVPVGDPDRQWELLGRKFRGLVDPILGDDRTAELLDTFAALEDVSDVGDVLVLTTPGAQTARADPTAHDR